MNAVCFGRKLSIAIPNPRTIPHTIFKRPRVECRVQNTTLKSLILSTVVSGALLWNQPSHANMIQTVSPTEVSNYGAPLPVEKIEKKRVWLVFTAGAATLFVFINIIENNPAWFPAVTRANKVLNTRRKERIRKTEDEEESLRAVEDGLQDARRQVITSNQDKETNTMVKTNVRDEKVLNGRKP